jgi:hypothetical protein
VSYVDLPANDFRTVQVRLDDGRWAKGSLEAYRTIEGVWSGYVRYTTGQGQTYLDWVVERRIRGGPLG